MNNFDNLYNDDHIVNQIATCLEMVTLLSEVYKRSLYGSNELNCNHLPCTGVSENRKDGRADGELRTC